jgi:hypothetical protein
MWIIKTMMLGERGSDGMTLLEGRQAVFLFARTPDLPAVKRATHPARISDMRDTVTPIGSVESRQSANRKEGPIP